MIYHFQIKKDATPGEIEAAKTEVKKLLGTNGGTIEVSLGFSHQPDTLVISSPEEINDPRFILVDGEQHDL